MSRISKAFQNAVILYDDEKNLIQKRMAFRISRAISGKTKMTTTFAKYPLDPDAPQILLKDNKRLKNGKFKITIANNTATLEAGSYYGYTGILNFLGTKKATGFYAFQDGYNVTGDFRDYLPSVRDNTCFNTDTIDHIFLTNAEKLEAENFCVVVDECTMSSSDHYPVFSDFKFIK